MKVCIVGATGKSGQRLVRAALARGHAVTALVRDRVKAQTLLGQDVDLRAVDFSDGNQIETALEGADAVINAAGYVTDGALYTDLVQRIIQAAAKALGAGGRFWLFGGAALLDVPDTHICTLDLPGVPRLFEAHRQNHNAVRATSLDWSMLCPGPMIDAPDGQATEGLILSTESWPVPRPPHTRFLPRAALSLAFKASIPRMTIYYEDAARVIMDHLERGGPLSGKRVGIALPRGQRRDKPAAMP